MTEGDQERANKAWENLGGDLSVDPVLRELAGDALPTIGAAHGAAQDALELQEAPDDPAS